MWILVGYWIAIGYPAKSLQRDLCGAGTGDFERHQCGASARYGFFCFAFWATQRRFTASAMRARPSGERFLFFLRGLVAAGESAAFLGLPLRTEGATESSEA